MELSKEDQQTLLDIEFNEKSVDIKRINGNIIDNILKSRNEYLLRNIPEEYFSPSIVEKIIDNYPAACEYLPNSYRNNRQFMLKFLWNNPYYPMAMGEQLKYDINFFIKVQSNPDAFSIYRSPDIQYLFKIPGNTIKILKANTFALSEVINYVQDDEWDKVAKLVLKNTHYLFYGMVNLSKVKNKKTLSEFVSKNESCFDNLTEEAKKDMSILVCFLANPFISYGEENKYAMKLFKNGLKNGEYKPSKIIKIIGDGLTKNMWDCFSYSKEFVKLCQKANVDPSQFEENFTSVYREIELKIKLDESGVDNMEKIERKRVKV